MTEQLVLLLLLCSLRNLALLTLPAAHIHKPERDRPRLFEVKHQPERVPWIEEARLCGSVRDLPKAIPPELLAPCNAAVKQR